MQARKHMIIIYTPAYYPIMGGTERQSQNLAEQLTSEGEDILIFTKRPPGTPSREFINKVPVYRIHSSPIPFLGTLIFAIQSFHFLLYYRHKIKVVLCQMFNTESLVLSFFARLLNIPLVIRPSSGSKNGNLYKMKQTFLGNLKSKCLFHNTKILIAVNDQIFSDFERYNPNKIRLIPNGVNISKFAPTRSDNKSKCRESLKIPQDFLVILFVGRLDDVKNLAIIIKLWPKFISMFPKTVLILVGEGPEEKPLKKLSMQQGIEKSTLFPGRIDDPLPYYSSADIFILPSHREGMSNSLLEAMATGLCVAVSNIAGNRLLIENNINGLLVEPTNEEAWLTGLTKLAKDQTLRLRLGEAAQHQVNRQCAMSSISKYYSSLFNLISSSNFQKSFPILAYHRVCEPPKYGIDLSPTQFELQIRWLAENGYSSLSLNELLDHLRTDNPFPKKKVIITFDDGHKDTFENAYPLLQKYGFTATVFLNTGLLGHTFWVGGRKPNPVTWHKEKPDDFDPQSMNWREYNFMSWEDVRVLKEAGWEFESHGVTHPFLTHLSDDQLRDELTLSKDQIRENLGIEPHFFCYPSGDYDLRVRAAVRSADYLGAVVSKSHYELEYFWDDYFSLDRIGIWNDVPFWKYKLLVNGTYPRLYRFIPSCFWNNLRGVFRFFKK